MQTLGAWRCCPRWHRPGGCHAAGVPGDQGCLPCPFWLSVVLAELGSQAQTDCTFFVCLLWPLTAALPIDLQGGLPWQLLGGLPRPQSWELGVGAGWAEVGEGRLENLVLLHRQLGKVRDPEVKFTLGQICILNTS